MSDYRTVMGWDYVSSMLDGLGHIVDAKGTAIIPEIYREDAVKLLQLLRSIGK